MSNNLANLESLRISPRVKPFVEHFNQVRITKVKLKGEVTDQVMDGEEEEDSLSRKLFERTESLLGRFNIK